MAPFPLSPDYGSSTRVINQLISLQKDKGIDFHVITYNVEGSYKDLLPSSITCNPLSKLFRMGFGMQTLFNTCTFSIFSAVRANTILRRTDIIHAHLSLGSLIASYVTKLLGVHPALLCDMHGLGLEEVSFVNRRLTALARLIELHALNSADLIIASNPILKNSLVKEYGLSSKKVKVVWDAIDVDSYCGVNIKDVTQFRSRLGINRDEILILYLGTISRIQGVDLLLEVMPLIKKEIPKIKFLVVGGRWNREYTKYLSKLRKFAIVLAGADYISQVPVIVNAADICISLKGMSNQSNAKLLVYGAAGKPTIAFDVPINKFILGEYGIYLRYPLSDRYAITEAVVKAIDRSKDDDYKKCLIQHIKKNFDLRRLRDELLGIYQKLL